MTIISNGYLILRNARRNSMLFSRRWPGSASSTRKSMSLSLVICPYQNHDKAKYTKLSHRSLESVLIIVVIFLHMNIADSSNLFHFFQTQIKFWTYSRFINWPFVKLEKFFINISVWIVFEIIKSF